MSKKRINPEVDRAIGRAQLPRVSSPRKYSIVGDGGTPVGPDPLSQLSQALTGFNKNLQRFAGANNVAGQKKAIEMLPELEQYVTDTAIELKKAFDKHGINPRFNPAVASTATALMGEQFGSKDVDAIVSSSDFRNWANAEIRLNEEPADFKQKLNDYVLHHLPNRNTDNKTTSAQWKRGYDPSVRKAIDSSKDIEALVQRKILRQDQDTKDANVYKAQETLKESIASGDVKTFKDLMSNMYYNYPTDSRRGIRFNDEILKRVVMPVFTNALENPDVDLDDLGESFDKIISMRRSTEKGSTVMFGSATEEAKTWWAKMYDQRLTQGSRSQRKAAADREVLTNQLKVVWEAWDDVIETNPELGLAGIKTPRDITVDNFDAVVDVLVKGNYVEFDVEKFEAIRRGGRAALLSDMSRAFTKNYNEEFADDAKMVENEAALKRQLIGDHPQFKAVLERLNIKKYLTTATFNTQSFLEELIKDIDVAEIATDRGLDAVVVGDLMETMLHERADAGALQAAKQLVGYYSKFRGKKALDPSVITGLRNVIEQTFTGDEQVDGDLKNILSDLEKADAVAPFAKKIPFKDMVYSMAQLSSIDGGSFQTEIAKWHNMKLSAIERRAEDWNEFKDFNTAGAANTVLLRIEREFDALLAAKLDEWKDGTAGDLENDWLTSGTKIKDSILNELSSRIPQYESEYKSLVENFEEQEKAQANAAQGAMFPKETEALNIQYSSNVDNIRTLFNKELLRDSGGHTKLAQNQKLDAGENFPVAFFTNKLGYSGDTAYGKIDVIREQAQALRGQMETHLSGLYIEKRRLGEAMLNNPNPAAVEANAAEIAAAEGQLKAHVLRYDGVNWKDISEGTAAIKFLASGEAVEIPVTHADVNFRSSIVVDSWEELNELEAAFDKYEAGEELDEESKKEVQQYVKFIENVTGVNIDSQGSPSLRANAQRKYRDWSSQQRMQMISTDPSKLPIEIKTQIHQRALDNFVESGRWKGKDYTQNDIVRVDAARNYNNFIAKNDFSVDTGVNMKEFMTLYGGLVGGRMYNEMHHLRGGNLRGRSGMSQTTTVVDPDKPLTDDQKKVIAQELAVAAVGWLNPTGGRPLNPAGDSVEAPIGHKKAAFALNPFRGRPHESSFIRAAVAAYHGVEPEDVKHTVPTARHPYNSMRDEYLGEYNRMKKLLDDTSDTRSPELAKAFQALHDSQTRGVERDYVINGEDLLAPFGIELLPLPTESREMEEMKDPRTPPKSHDKTDK